MIFKGIAPASGIAMKLPRRQFLHLAAGAAALPAVSRMAGAPSFPARTLPEFIAYAKAKPGRISFASGGNGTSQHVSGELLKMMTGIDMVHVPYRGVVLAHTDLIAGRMHIMFDSLPSSI